MSVRTDLTLTFNIKRRNASVKRRAASVKRYKAGPLL